MHSTSESPNVAVASSLSDILEDDPPKRFCLSKASAATILRNTERSGKILPEGVMEILRRTASGQ